MIYLASPYSHPDPAVRDERFRAACQATAAMIRAGGVVFSPVVHSHPLVAYGLPTGWDFWDRYDRAVLARCDAVAVLTLDGCGEQRRCAGRGGDGRGVGPPGPVRPAPVAILTPTLAHGAAEGGG